MWESRPETLEGGRDHGCTFPFAVETKRPKSHNAEIARLLAERRSRKNPPADSLARIAQQRDAESKRQDDENKRRRIESRQRYAEDKREDDEIKRRILQTQQFGVFRGRRDASNLKSARRIVEVEGAGATWCSDEGWKSMRGGLFADVLKRGKE